MPIIHRPERRGHLGVRQLAFALVIANGLCAVAAAPAAAEPLRVKIITVFGPDANTQDPSQIVGVGAVRVEIDGVSATTGDGTNATRCVYGKNHREFCTVPSQCPGGLCRNPGDNDLDGNDDQGFGIARVTIQSGLHTIRIPAVDLTDNSGKFRVGFVAVHSTDDQEQNKCAPLSTPEGDVAYPFSPASVNPASLSDYEVAIRIVPVDSEALVDVGICEGPFGSNAALKCKRTINKSSVAFTTATVKALEKCRLAALTGKLPANIDCADDAKTVEAVLKASDKLRAAIGKACGGDDKACGGDTENEPEVASLGFSDKCPNLEGQGCNGILHDCGSIATCVACINAAAVDQALALYTSDFPADPKLQKQLNKCQQAILKAGADELTTRANVLEDCWEARFKGKDPGPCTFGRSFLLARSVSPSEKLTKAGQKMRAVVCKACGALDATTCDGPHAFVVGQIRFAASCPDVSIPNAPLNQCAGPVTDLAGIVNCVDCVTSFKSACMASAAAPSLIAYPTECQAP